MVGESRRNRDPDRFTQRGVHVKNHPSRSAVCLTWRLESSILGLVTLVQRLSAIVLCLTLIAGNAAVCAGWAATPEARMACCAEEQSCPMHQRDSGNSVSGRQLTQAQADSCCASSEREQSNGSNPTLIAAISNAVLGSGITLPASAPALFISDGWRTVSPIPKAAVPRHVLLSVFLV
jgi:hypothetical protein